MSLFFAIPTPDSISHFLNLLCLLYYCHLSNSDCVPSFCLARLICQSIFKCFHGGLLTTESYSFFSLTISYGIAKGVNDDLGQELRAVSYVRKPNKSINIS
uniref:Uncharacterized protein n=1 Tax=Cacopsylla melanoneura TaxID=428564 RepID=A0A8D8TT90_9HEMI